MSNFLELSKLEKNRRIKNKERPAGSSVGYDKGTQELKILASVIIDRLK